MRNRLQEQMLAGVVAAGVGLSASVAVAKTHVAVPTVDWMALVPYVRANIVPELNGTDFEVFVCPAHIDRSVVTPFDEALSDFTRVLITQSMRTDPKLQEAVAATTQLVRRQVSALAGHERAGYRDLFWKSLSQSPDVLPRLESAFLAARGAGRLRCWLCDKDPGYAPLARRLPPQ